MSITTKSRLHGDQLQALLPAGATYTCEGALETPTAKTITFDGIDDAAGQAAVTTAAGQFIDRGASRDLLLQRLQQVLAANATYLAAPQPTNAQVVAQVQRNTRAISALIRFTLGQLDDISNT